MILEEETFRKFGYYPGELKQKSSKKILATCDKCGKVRITSKHDYCALCLSCSHKGKHPSEETKRKMRGRTPWNKGKTDIYSEEAKQKMAEAAKGRLCSDETRKKLSEAHKGRKSPMKGKHHSEETRKKMREANKGKISWMKGKRHTEEAKQKQREASKGNKSALGNRLSEETRRKMSESTKKNWQDPDYIKKVFAGWNAKPNKQENNVGTILQKHLPDEYAYNGDFSCGITIGGKIPDFVNVNGEKIVIEVFGPWHDEVFMRDIFGDDIPWKRTEFGTKAHYSQFGYKCVVLWQEDLERKDAEDFVLSVLRENEIL